MSDDLGRLKDEIKAHKNRGSGRLTSAVIDQILTHLPEKRDLKEIRKLAVELEVSADDIVRWLRVRQQRPTGGQRKLPTPAPQVLAVTSANASQYRIEFHLQFSWLTLKARLLPHATR